MEIITTTPIIVQQEITSNKIEVLSIIDSNSDRNIIANIKVANKEFSLMLWEGNVYDNLGQWTDEIVVERIKEVISQGNIY